MAAFTGPADSAERLERDWEHDALYGMADHDDPAELAYLEDQQADRSRDGRRD